MTRASFHGRTSMLNIFRKGPWSKIMLVILGIGLFAIVATGFGTDGMGGLGGGGTTATTGDTLVEVGDEAVTSTEISDQVNRQLDRLRQQNPELDLAAFFRGGGYEEILNQLVTAKAMLGFGREQGFAASKRMVDSEIASVPAFQNLAGQFDPEAFQRALRSERVSEQQLREDLEGSLIQRQILVPVAGSPFVPQGLAQQYASLLLEQRSGSVGLVTSEAVAAGLAPSDTEIAAFYRQNQSRYAVPERRVVRYATIGAEQVAAAAQPTEAELQAAYREAGTKYAAREGRDLSQVVLPDQAAARAFAAKLAGGTSFAQAASQAGFSVADTRLGAQERQAFERLTNAAVANAAFSAPQGGTTQPIQSPLGWHIVRVDAINNRPAVPFNNVRAELVAQVGERKRQEALANFVTKVDDALGGGASMEEAAQANGLRVQETPPLTATGQNPADPAFRAPAELQPILKAGFDMSADEDPVVETLGPTQFAMVAVGRIVPAAAPALTQIREQVRADLIRDRAFARARTLAQSLADKINRGLAPAQAFATAGVRLQPIQRISARRIEIARSGQQVPPPLVMLFSLPKGRAKILAAPGGAGWFVVHTENTVPGNAASQPQLIQATRTQFERILGEEYSAQFARAVQDRLEVERNEGKIRSLKQQLQTGGPIQ
jgi:peptidyl-prolyl cis-trans isomerase D